MYSASRGPPTIASHISIGIAASFKKSYFLNILSYQLLNGLIFGCAILKLTTSWRRSVGEILNAVAGFDSNCSAAAGVVMR